MNRTEYTHITRFATVLLTAVLIVYALMMAESLLLPIAWALLISLLILPLVQWLEIKMPRPLAIILVLILVSGIFGFIFYLLSVQVVGVLGEVPRISQRLDQWMADLQQYAEIQWGISNEMFSRQLATSVSGMINTALVAIRNSLSTIFQTLTYLTVIPLYIYFMLYYRDLFYTGFLQIVKNYEHRAAILVRKVNNIVQRYLSGMLLVTFIIGILFYLDLLVLDIKYAFFFAALLAVFNLIPYIGVIVSSLVVILYSLVTSGSLFYPLALLVSLWFIQFLENNFITPFIVGTRVKVNPLAALIAIFAGSSIWGISGMVLFLPLVGVLKTVFDEIDALKPYGMMLGTSNDRKEKESPNA
ncbi:MAG TPA: AI-2E family transporter [Balneolaceae bacterium]|nr:AI-2E family transporter [Balneolaceae bacterium]